MTNDDNPPKKAVTKEESGEGGHQETDGSSEGITGCVRRITGCVGRNFLH